MNLKKERKKQFCGEFQIMSMAMTMTPKTSKDWKRAFRKLRSPLLFTRYMLWKIQSGTVPPFFYVVIAEKEKLNTLRGFLCPQLQNAVEPNVQSN